MKNFNNSMADDYHTSQSNLVANSGPVDPNQAALGRPSNPDINEAQLGRSQSRSSIRQQISASLASGNHQPTNMDELMDSDLNYLQHDAPLDGGESTFGGGIYSQLGASQQLTNREESVMNMGSDLHDDEHISGRSEVESPIGFSHNEQALNQLSPDNVDVNQKPMQQAGFLVSFMVDARGGAMRGCRHSGVRVIIPPNSAQMPMRITCRYLRKERLVHPPPLMEGEACASKIMEVGPAGAKFLGPVLIEVPHFASLRDQEREIIILRSDRGEVWREHLFEADDGLIEQIIRSADSIDQENQYGGGGSSSAGGTTILDEKKRLTRIVTNEFPQYFAIISRVRQEVFTVGPEGSTVNSQVVPKVQAIFTDGALTKRIKIGLQSKGTNNSKAQQDSSQLDSLNSPSNSSQLEQQQQEQPEASASQLRSGSPLTADQSLEDRAQSPLSNQGSQAGGTRPNSASAKRRSRFLACFGAKHGSAEFLDTDHDVSSAGSSPKLINEAKRKLRLGSDNSDGRSSPASNSSFGASQRQEMDLVPDDYYIEKEPPLILNVEPKTYGKRLASSSAQTDYKLNGFLISTSARKQAKKKGLLQRGRRKNKTQLTIHCVEPAAGSSQKAPEAPAGGGDSSSETVDTDSTIQDVVTSQDQKWRTCTIQTDSDSVTVNYVMIAPDEADKSEVSKSKAKKAGAGQHQDDGYVSGSGDINKQGKGLFKLVKSSGKEQQEAEKEQVDGKVGKKKAGKKEKKAAKKAKEKAKKSEAELKLKERVDLDMAAGDKVAGDEEQTIANAPAAEDEADTKQPQDTSIESEQQQQVCSLSASEDLRSFTPTSGKELKLKMKLEKQEKLRLEKEEKKAQKELEEAAAKAEKLRKKQEKEAKKAALKAAKKSTSSSASERPESSLVSTELVPIKTVTTQTVTFADQAGGEPAEFAPTSGQADAAAVEAEGHDKLRQLDSIQRIVDETSESYEREKERLSQEDGRDMIRVSISDKVGDESAVRSDSFQSESQLTFQQQEATLRSEDNFTLDEDKLISLSDSTLEPSRVAELVQPAEAAASEPPGPEQRQPELTSEEAAADDEPMSEERRLSSIASQLVSEATEEAVKDADKLLAGRRSEGADEAKATLGAEEAPSSGSVSKKELAKRAKEEKERLKRETKAKLAEEKRLAKEAKKGKKTKADSEAPPAGGSKVDLKEEKTKRELEAKLEKEAKKRAEEDEKLRRKEEKLNQKRLEREKKLAEVEAKKKAKAEQEKAKLEAKEAKRLAELAKKQHKKDKSKASKKSPESTGSKKTDLPTAGEADAAVAEENRALESAQREQQQQQEPETNPDPLSGMTPIKTETEVETIVEEVVGDDGILTKTTKTIETKYVTMRQEEEIQVDEKSFDANIENELTMKKSLSQSSSSFSSGSSIDSEGRRKAPVACKTAVASEQTQTKEPIAAVAPRQPLEHAELNEILATPSYFADERPAELAEAKNLSPKKELKKRVKLNKNLIKRACRLAKAECKKAQREAKRAESEIAVCDEAAKEAQKALRKALKESKRARKLVAKEHKKLDKVDKALDKRQKKAEKKQRKVDKQAEKQAKKLEKEREREVKREAKLERKNSSKSKKSIKLEDIGEPVLKSSSRLSIGQTQVVSDESQLVANETMVRIEESPNSIGQAPEEAVIANQNDSADTEGMEQVEMSLDDNQDQIGAHPEEPRGDGDEEVIVHRIFTEVETIHPNGQVSEDAFEETLRGQEARAAAAEASSGRVGSESDEEIDVVNELPQIKGKAQYQLEQD